MAASCRNENKAPDHNPSNVNSYFGPFNVQTCVLDQNVVSSLSRFMSNNSEWITLNLLYINLEIAFISSVSTDVRSKVILWP